METVIVINNDQMGHGDRELGQKTLATCLRKLGVAHDLDAIVLYNAGVRLTAKGSCVAVELGLLYEKGVDIISCGTCVKHYGLEDRMLFDQISNMDEILAVLHAARKVITL
ncbi:MAG: DsrE family protein [Phycisphaerae bacterium]